jgi:spermidine synthase
MSYPVIYADEYKHAMGLSDEEYAVYESIRKTARLKQLDKIPGLRKILKTLDRRGLLCSRTLDDGDLFLWVEEPVRLLEKGHLSTLKIPEKFCEIESPFQKIEFYENDRFVYFKLNDIIQYHSAEYGTCLLLKAGLPAALTGKAAEVLILGGGDGLIAMEVLRHAPERVTIVEIDSTIPETFMEHSKISMLCHNSLRHKKVHLVIGDAFDFTEKMEGTYDLIQADIEFHGTRQSRKRLASSYISLLSRCSRALSRQGIFVIMAPFDCLESHFLESAIVPLLSRFSEIVGKEVEAASIEDRHLLLFRQFFTHVKRIRLKMFFTDDHMIYYCSHSEIDDEKIADWLRRNLPQQARSLPMA